jgi:hypothetical protein
MNDTELLKRLSRVAAPKGFEDRVLDALHVRLQLLPGRRRARAIRLATAATAAGVLALLAGFNLFVLRGPDPSALNALRADGSAVSGTIRLNEPVDYRHEVRTASYAPGTVYILEQVSEASNTLIKY